MIDSIVLRELDRDNPSEVNFIYNSWLRSTWSDNITKHRKNDHFKIKTQEIDNALSKSEVAVACFKDDPNFIYGYVVYKHIKPDVLIVHYAYTKAPFRKYGVLKSILESMVTIKDDPIVITYINNKIEPNMETYRLVYKPELKGL